MSVTVRSMRLDRGGVYAPGGGTAATQPRSVRCGRRVLALQNVVLRRQVRRLRWVATHDPLTGVLNRAGLARVWPLPGDLALLDLDKFKPVNDTFGHAAGDHVLRVVAERVGRFAVAVARLGGDEFAAVLPGGIQVAQAVAAAVAEPIGLPGGHLVAVTASIGLCLATDLDLPTVLRRADTAMYRAKQTGGSVVVWHTHADDRLAARCRAADRLRDAHAPQFVDPLSRTGGNRR